MDVKLNHCQACLSGDRKLYPLRSLKDHLQANSLWQLLSADGGICWECNHVIRKFSGFRQQIHQVQKILLSAKIHNFTTFSKLGLNSTSSDHQYTFNHDPLANLNTNQEEKHAGNINFRTEINKLETIKQEIKIEQEIDFNDTDIEIRSPKEKFSEEDDIVDEEPMDIKPSRIDVYVDVLKEKKLENQRDLNNIEIEIHSTKEKISGDDDDVIDEEPIEITPTGIDIYVDILKEKKVENKRVKKSIGNESDEEVKNKFRTVIFTEQEMLQNREKKRMQPNFKKMPYNCDSCVLGFLRKDTYDVHMEKKHDENVGPHSCPVCLVRFTSEKQVSLHKAKHYVRYRCKLCKYETAELCAVLSHCKTKHVKDQVERIHCGYCDFVAKTPEELSEHTSTEHSVSCKDCGEKFKALSTLKAHIKRIHRVKRDFSCELCAKSFKTRSRLESHLARHSAGLARQLAYCARCNVQYASLYVYRNHLKTSANHADQSYQCVECNKWFASKTYWKKHYDFYHLHKSEYHCNICNKLFISDFRLKNHRQTQHGLSRTRNHHCNICGKQFYTLGMLRGHQLTHSEQRSFMCEDCGDTFKQRPALYTHCRLVHQGLKRKKRKAQHEKKHVNTGLT